MSFIALLTVQQLYDLSPYMFYLLKVCNQVTRSQTWLFHNSTHHCWHCTSFATRPVVGKEGKAWHILTTCHEPSWRPLQCLSHLGCCPLDRNPASWCYVIAVIRHIARHAKISSLICPAQFLIMKSLSQLQANTESKACSSKLPKLIGCIWLLN